MSLEYCGRCGMKMSEHTTGGCPSRVALAPGAELAWLIERGQQEGCEPPLWWAGRFTWDWTRNVSEAVRFARREDAERVVRGLSEHFEKPFGRAEHVPESERWRVNMTAPLNCICDVPGHSTFSDCNFAPELVWTEETT